MKDYLVTEETIKEFTLAVAIELRDSPSLLFTSQDPSIGKWGMAKLWRMWMSETAKFMAANGSVMPLMIAKDGSWFGERPFNEKDAHELFTSQWLGLDGEGKRLSWAKDDREGMRKATKAERYIAMMKHENWCIEKGINLPAPKDSDYFRMKKEQDGM